MAIDYVMPKLAMAMNEGTINEWCVAEGDYVEKGQPLANIETEKVAYEVEAPHTGYFHIILPAGETVDCESLIAQFAESEEELASLQAGADAAPAGAGPEKVLSDRISGVAPASVAAPPARIAGERIKASPLARRLAGEAGLDLALVSGTGPGGRIVKRDVLAAREREPLLGTAGASGSRELARLPMTGLRQTIASRMTRSLQEAAQLSSSWESDITALLAMRQSFLAREEQLGTRVSVNAFLIKAMVYAVRRVPIANSCLEGNEIVIYDNVNMGVAVSGPGATGYDSSLMVAVLHNVDRMGLVEIDKSLKALVQRVRNGQSTADDLSGSTITLSSTAGIAPPGLTTTPVLNLPNAALLGPSTPIERPVVRDGEVQVRTMLPLSFTFDHRVLDGEPAARCMQALHEALERPELMLA